MPEKKTANVTMRVRIGENELEVSGPPDFVKKEIADFREEQKKIVPISSSGITAGQARSSIQATTKKISVSQFFRKLSTRTDVDRALAAGCYLEKYEKCESFTAGEVREVIRTAKINPPKNTNDSINANIKKGLIMAAGDKDAKRAFVLTSDGEDTINEMLNE